MEFIKKYKKVIIYSTSAVLGAILCLYLCIIFALPVLLNSKTFVNKAQKIIAKNTGYNISGRNLDIKITPFLSLYFKADKVLAEKNGEKILDMEGFKGKAKLNKLKHANAKYLFLNMTKIQKGKKKSDFKISSLPDIYIDGASVVFDETKELKGNFTNFSIKKINGRQYIKFYGEFSSIFFKDSLILGDKGYLYTQKDSLFAKDFKILSKTSSLSLNGKIFDRNKKGENNYDFYIKGKDVQTADFMASLLYFQKSADNSKKFIENFYDFKGIIDVDLNFKNDGIYGNCTAKELGAKTVLFDAPLYFKEAVFIFNKTSVKSTAEGTLADEAVVHNLQIADIMSPERLILGKIESKLQNKIDKYIPGLKTVGSEEISVEYFIKKKKITVDYLLSIKEGGDIFYKSASLGLKDKSRRLFVHTLKNDKVLYIKNYDYSILKDSEAFNIVTGRGLFVKKEGKMKPKYLASKTNGFAPASVAGSFGRFISGGEFSGNLKYDFQKDKLYGNFTIKNALHKDFFIQRAEVNADKKCINITAEGKYRGEKFTSKMNARNKVGNQIVIYNMDLFLDKYTARNGHKTLGLKPHKRGSENLHSKVKDIDVTIDNWKIKINRITKDRIILNNVSLAGSLKDGIFRFSTSDIYFAKGVLSAKGLYDFKKKYSAARFVAKRVDANTAADLIFDLKGQVEGIANGILYIKASNKLDDVKAKVLFKIDKGYLPKLGDLEFKNRITRRNIKLSNLIRIKDEENNPINPAEFASDIKGVLYLDNQLIKNVAITSKQKHLSMLFEGQYDIREENADLMIFGKYNSDSQKKVKILFMPLSFVVKLIFRPENSFENYKEKFEKVPDISKKPGDTSLFRIKIKGSAKEDNMNVEMKRIY